MSSVMPAEHHGETEVLANVHVNTTAKQNIVVDYTLTLQTRSFRQAFRFDSIPMVNILKTIYTSIVVSSVTAEVRQISLIGNEERDLSPMGHVFVSVIPTSRNNDAQSGTNAATVLGVRDKRTFPLSTDEQRCVVYTFDVGGFELDLALDPRRGAGPVMWLGNSGIVCVTNTNVVAICAATFRINLICSGNSVLW